VSRIAGVIPDVILGLAALGVAAIILLALLSNG
jgi:hypothetical protein